MDDGFPKELDKTVIHGFGNAVVPEIPYQIFREIKAWEEKIIIKTMNNRYTTFFALLKKMPEITKEEAVKDFTNGRTNSLRALTDMEVRELIKAMQQRLGQAPSQNPKHKQANDERKPMRGKIVHLLCLMGYTQPDGRPDFDRIDNFIIGIGSNNPRRQILNYLYKNELLAVLNQVEEIYKKNLKIRR